MWSKFKFIYFENLKLKVAFSIQIICLFVQTETKLTKEMDMISLTRKLSKLLSGNFSSRAVTAICIGSSKKPRKCQLTHVHTYKLDLDGILVPSVNAVKSIYAKAYSIYVSNHDVLQQIYTILLKGLAEFRVYMMERFVQLRQLFSLLMRLRPQAKVESLRGRYIYAM